MIIICDNFTSIASNTFKLLVWRLSFVMDVSLVMSMKFHKSLAVKSSIQNEIDDREWQLLFSIPKEPRIFLDIYVGLH